MSKAVGALAACIVAVMACTAVPTQVDTVPRAEPSPGFVRAAVRTDAIGWTEVANSHPFGTRVRLTYDPVRAQVVGVDGSKLYGWDGAQWNELSSTTLGASITPQIAWDAARGELVLFDDYDDKLYTLRSNTWRLRNPAHRPPDRLNPSLAYDARSQRVILFGGDNPLDADHPFSDTWAWDGTDWTQVAAGVPTARNSAAMAFDAKRNRLVLFGGMTSAGKFLDDTWVFEGTAWTRPSLIDHPVIANAVITYDSAREVIVALGDDPDTERDAWAYDGATWTLQAQPDISAAPDAMAYDPMRRLIVAVLAGSTFTVRAMGDSCVTAADCPTYSTCTDGVCCVTDPCGTCETCAGFSPGQCTPILRAEDPDTCPAAQGKSCDGDGQCRRGPGEPATDPTTCASGHVADGVCCDSDCLTPCYACRADLKESGSRSGVCDFARAGTDTRNACVADDPASCKRDGFCDGRGACRALSPSGARCGAIACVDNRVTGELCDGLGACRNGAEGVACGAYTCSSATGCLTGCTTNADCATRYKCTQGQCRPDQGVICADESHLQLETGALQDCGLYTCEGSACKSACANVADCVFPAQCTAEGACVSFTGSAGPSDGSAMQDDAGGCALAAPQAVTASPAMSATLVARVISVVGAIALIARRGRRGRRASTTKELA